MSQSEDPLLSAVRSGDAAGVRRLAGESPNRLDAHGPDGLTALMVAASIGAQETVALLLELGADAGLRDGEGRTAADLAFANGHTDLGQRLGPETEAERVLR